MGISIQINFIDVRYKYFNFFQGRVEWRAFGKHENETSVSIKIEFFKKKKQKQKKNSKSKIKVGFDRLHTMNFMHAF
jgi:hypothetical protein